MKTLYIFFFVSCVSIFSVIETSAQTSILPLVEINALHISSVKINEIDCDASPDCIQDGFVVNAPYLGLGVRLEQKIMPNVDLYYSLTYNRKKFDYNSILYDSHLIIKEIYIVFNYFKHDIGFSYRFNDFFIDLGGMYSSLRNIKYAYKLLHPFGEIETDYRDVGHKNYFGYTAGIGYELNRFQFRLAVHQSFRHSENVKWNSASTDATPTAISLSAGYRFQLLDKIQLGGRKKGCPTF